LATQVPPWQVWVALSQQDEPQAVWLAEQVGLATQVPFEQVWVELLQQLDPQAVWPVLQVAPTQVLFELLQVCP
jgi:hypothetical protein